MCSISGIISLTEQPIPYIEQDLAAMNFLQLHRGPDGQGTWKHSHSIVGFAHTRLAILDLSSGGTQPMSTPDDKLWITYNGEIYNYLELRAELTSLGVHEFRTRTDTEVIIAAYRKWGEDCVHRFRGMFAFAIWDEDAQKLFCARDRFGIKPFFYTIVDNIFYFASEAKALLPFLPSIEIDNDGLKDYLAFQFCLAGKTLFSGISELLPGHHLRVCNGVVSIKRYWEVHYIPDFDHTEKFFEERLHELLLESVHLHLRSDVPLGAYLSGGLDSSTVASAAAQKDNRLLGFTGKFSHSQEYDESHYARVVSEAGGFNMHEIDIQPQDFIENIRRVIYHRDFPIAGPGSFPQFMVSRLASKHRKVVLGGQGGDEIFGGYARYLIAYFEQCIKAAINGKAQDGNFIVTYESIIPNLISLNNYKPLLREFWSEGLFDDMDKRYFRLINRAPHLGDEIQWNLLGDYSPYETFKTIFYGNNVGKQSYFDLMTHFDFKTLLPALLQVEDRMSMAHGLESRVPLLDHVMVEFAATMPSNIKFKEGEMKYIFKKAIASLLPKKILDRKDKMGFPTPLTEWINGPARDFVQDIFSSRCALERSWVDNRKVTEKIGKESRFGRSIWALLSLEIWQQEYHDKGYSYRQLREDRRI